MLMKRNIFRDSRGVAMTEYAFLLVLIAMVALASVARFGEANRNLFQSVADYLGVVVNDGIPEPIYRELPPVPVNNTAPITTNPTDNSEIPDNTSTSYAIAVDTSEANTFEVGNDDDWWQLEVQALSDLYITLGGENLGSGAANFVDLMLMDETGSAISSLAYGNPTALMANRVEPGTYYISAASRNTSSVGGYRVAVQEVFDTPTAIDQDNTVLFLDNPFEEDMLLGDNTDTFSFSLLSDEDVLFSVPATPFNKRLSILDDTGSVLSISGNSLGANGVLVTDLPAGDYYARIERLSGAGTYEATVRAVDDIPSAAAVRSGAQAQEVAIGDTVESELFIGEAGDMYTFTVASNGTPVTFAVSTPGFLSEIYLYGTDATTVLDTDISGSSGTPEPVSATLNAGTYYVGIERRNSSSIGTYTLTSSTP